jgi:hypothetical protein|tara:strand:- start:188 stop:697 length:510 start_codon:yes stop_codon:yes gene_type:complete
MNYKDFTVPELAQLISPSSEAFQELKKRGILRTNNVVGELGEHYAIEFYNSTPSLPGLSIADITVKNIDAISRNGETYSIKTVSSKSRTTGSFWDPESIENNEKKFQYLLIVVLNDTFSLEKILELTWDDFFEYKKYNKRMQNYNISITKKLIKNVNVVYEKSTEKSYA